MISRFREFAEGVGAIAATFALVVGVPWVLVSALGSPLGRLIDAFGGQITSSSLQVEAVLLAGLTLVVWLAWAQLMYALVVEVIAFRRGRLARSVAVFPGIQRTAGRLVAGCALLVTSFTPTLQMMSPAMAAGLGPPVAFDDLAVGEDVIDAGNQGPSWTELAQQRRTVADGVTYLVQPGDTFWSISEQFLGDGLRWSEVRELNAGRSVAKGIVLGPQAETLEGGWSLQLPADAVLPLAVEPETASDSLSSEVPATATTASSHVTVRAGNHFWGLAVNRLTDAWGRAPDDDEVVPYWHELIEANRSSLVEADDPDVIHADQVFVVPPPPADPWRPAAEPRTEVVLDLTDAQHTVELPDGMIRRGIVASGLEDFVAEESPPEPPTDSASIIDLRQPEPEPNLSATPLAAPTPSPTSTPNPTSTPKAAASAAAKGPSAAVPRLPAQAVGDVDDDGWGRLGLGTTGTGLLAASLALAIRRRRRQQWQHRPDAMVPTPGVPRARAFEASLAQVAQPERLEVAQLAARALGSALPENPPNVRYVSVTDDRVAVSLSEEAMPAGVFGNGESSGLWQVHELDDAVRQDLMERRGEIATVPGLVHLGEDPATNAHVLIDLEHVLRLRVDGPPDAVRPFLSTMAAELAVSGFADDMHVICVGLGEELAGLNRVEVVDSIEAAIAAARGHVVEVGEKPGDEASSHLAARVQDPIESPPPVVIVIAEEAATSDGDPVHDCLLDLALRGVVVVAPGIESSWRVALSPGELRVEPLDFTLKRTDLNADQFAALGALIDATDGRDENYIPAEQVTSSVSEFGVQACESELDIELQVLGAVQVVGAAREFSSIRAIDVIAYLAFHRDGANADQLKTWVWPLHAPPSAKAFANVMSRARKGLGQDDHGASYLTRADAQGIYRLLPSVQTDFDRLLGHIASADTAAGSGDGPHAAASELTSLRAALQLVRGVPFTGGGGSGFLWADGGARSRVDYVIDETVHRCADLALSLNDLETARWAVFKGLDNIPACEHCYQRRFRIADADNNPTELRSAMASLEAIVALDADEPEGSSLLSPQTLTLFDELTPGRRASQG